MACRYAVITPARNEGRNLPRLGRAVVRQTLRPQRWMIVDDASTDDTGEIAAGLAKKHDWIGVVARDTSSTAGGALVAGRRSGRDVLAFNAGLAALPDAPDYVVKVDADVSFGPEYFERLLAEFDADPRLGIGSGTCWEQNEGGEWHPRHVTRSHVRGATRVWRWACLKDVLPLEERLGWDVVDELQASLRGWRTTSFAHLRFLHHRAVGARDGARRDWSAQGAVAHYTHYRLSYLVLRALYQARRHPAALALVTGYLGSAVRREPRHHDPAVRAHLRAEQSLRKLPLRFREAVGRTTA